MKKTSIRSIAIFVLWISMFMWNSYVNAVPVEKENWENYNFNTYDEIEKISYYINSNFNDFIKEANDVNWAFEKLSNSSINEIILEANIYLDSLNEIKNEYLSEIENEYNYEDIIKIKNDYKDEIIDLYENFFLKVSNITLNDENAYLWVREKKLILDNSYDNLNWKYEIFEKIRNNNESLMEYYTDIYRKELDTKLFIAAQQKSEKLEKINEKIEDLIIKYYNADINENIKNNLVSQLVILRDLIVESLIKAKS